MRIRRDSHRDLLMFGLVCFWSLLVGMMAAAMTGGALPTLGSASVQQEGVK